MSSNGRKLKILMADNNCIVCYGIKMVVKKYFENAEIIEAMNGKETLKAAKANPDINVFMLDYFMPNYHGAELLAALKKKRPNTPVIFISGSEEYELVKSSIDKGASGFIPKNTPPQIIIQVINLVLAGGTYIPKSLLQYAPQGNSYEKPLKPCLTHRQLEILKLIAKGHSYKDIAEKLEVSRHTVKSHATCIRNLLGAKNRIAVIENARGLGLIK